MAELLPCPFCGGNDVRLRRHPSASMSWVSCVGCGLEAPSETGVTDDAAVAYWNRRAAPPVSNVVATCCGKPMHVGSPEGYTLECCQNFVVSDRREAIARIIDPHSFMPDDSGDYIVGEIVKQSRELALSKADRVIEALTAAELPDEPKRQTLDRSEGLFGTCQQCGTRQNLGRSEEGEVICGSCADGNYLAEWIDYGRELRKRLSPSPQTNVVGDQHPDDLAVDRFAVAMKAKLARKREEGRGGWDDPEQCSLSYLGKLLVEHIEKGDRVDICNFAMMIHQRAIKEANHG